jgi:hypothetical protein
MNPGNISSKQEDAETPKETVLHLRHTWFDYGIPVESAGSLGVDADLVAAEWRGCDVCLFVGPPNSGPGDVANVCYCLQQVNVAAYCCCSCCTH